MSSKIRDITRMEDKTTQPIKNTLQQKRLLAWYASHDREMYIFALIMLYTGFRQGDVRYLTVDDVQGEFLEILERKTRYKIDKYETDLEKYKKGELTRKPKKPKGPRKVLIHEELKKELRRYIKGKSGDRFLFPSSHSAKEPLSYYQIRNRLLPGAKAVGIEDFGTHALRKTAAYIIYLAQGLVEAQKFLGHENVYDTERYLGLNQEMVNAAVRAIGNLTPNFVVNFD